ncbi:MAG: type I glyceraldehyde-3-phosphate dehydrogenase [Tissierellia bacterium]|nr:type I glyceraldehyde-3-phosphate dehydrogenase [Tissierellia bacterium]
MSIKVGVNGFGRIGRDVVRGYYEKGFNNKNLELVAINATGDLEAFRNLFKYDSAYGRFEGTVETYEEGLVINGDKIKFVNHRDPAEIPWKDLGVELVIDSTGAFRDQESLEKHIAAGAKKVLLTAPGKGVDCTVVMGVNEDTYDAEKHNVISNASCTTNCLAPLTKVILDNFGIVKGLMTTIHAYTNDQNIMDNKHKKDMRRARAAAINMIPTSTGAAKAVGLVIPEVQGKLTGYAVRVPVITGSMVDVVFELEKEATVEEINAAVKKAAEGEMKGVLAYTEDPLVSTDIVADDHSSIFDSGLTLVKDNMVKLVSWYDNEWGYAMRVLDLAEFVADKM